MGDEEVRTRPKHLKQDVMWSIEKLYRMERDPYATGFETWSYKQDLLLLKWWIDDMINQCGTYAGEEEFIEAHEKKRMWDKLKQRER